MPLGDLVAQVVGGLFGQVFFEGSIKKILFPTLRIPGVVVRGCFLRGAAFGEVWRSKDTALGPVASITFYEALGIFLAVI